MYVVQNVTRAASGCYNVCGADILYIYAESKKETIVSDCCKQETDQSTYIMLYFSVINQTSSNSTPHVFYIIRMHVHYSLYRVEMNSQVGERLKSPSSTFSKTIVSTIEGAQMGLVILLLLLFKGGSPYARNLAAYQ
jgi:hypothetical protein